MRLRILFVDSDDPSSMPNALAVTDDYLEDEWGRLPDYYVEEKEEALAVNDLSDGRTQVREAFVTIPDDAVRALFATPVLKGVVEPVTP